MPEEAVLNVLCHACQNLFAADPGLSTRILNKENLLYIAHHRICLLYTSVGTGCHLCALILAEISGLYSAITQEWESHKNHDDQIWVRFCLDKVKDLNLELHAGEPHNEERFGRGILHLRKANSIDISETTNPLSGYERLSTLTTSSLTTLDQILKWMMTCKESHADCDTSSERTAVPKRLLDVGNSETENLIYLVQSKALAKPLRYMTLSHCWGGNLACKLTHESLKNYERGAMISSLPQTFQQAVYLANKLGCRYVWIDALCIIQDDDLDWREEAAKMADVYFGSELSIAASDSQDSNGGLFRERNPLATTPCRIPDSYAQEETYAVRALGNHRTALLDETQLSTRAWTIQERLLAPRVVHFTQKEVFWECASCVCCETASEPLPHPIQGPVKKWLASPSDRGSGLNIANDFWDVWSQIVGSYTTAKLTYISDKQVAISGLARRMHEVSRGELGRYLAGFWEFQFPRQLGWSCAVPTRRLELESIAPTWSWACVNGPVYFVDQEVDADGFETPIVDCISVTTDPVADPFGPVRTGSVKLRGRMCKIAIKGKMATRNPTLRSPVPIVEDFELAGVSCSLREDVLDESEDSQSSSSTEGDYMFKWDRHFAIHENERFQTVLFLLLLFDLRVRGTMRRTDRELEALVLEPTRVKNGQFRRVGFFSTLSHDCVAAVEEAAGSHHVREECYESFDEASGYTIEIV